MRTSTIAILFIAGLSAAGGSQPPKEIRITAPTYAITFREGWSESAMEDSAARAVSQRDFGATMQMGGRFTPDPKAAEDSIYALLGRQMNERVKRHARSFANREFTVSEWNESSRPNTIARFYVGSEGDFLFLAVLTYSISPELCCVPVADADAAMETLVITVPATALRPRASGKSAWAVPSGPARARDLLGRKPAYPGPSRAASPVPRFCKP